MIYVKRNDEKGFCVCMCDIDFFKKVNDTRGHDCGDYVLKTLSMKFQNFMKEKGILDELKEAGISEGDTVRIYGWEFDYYE